MYTLCCCELTDAVGTSVETYSLTFFFAFYPRDVVSGVFATVTWLAGWLVGSVSVTAGIVSKRLNLS